MDLENARSNFSYSAAYNTASVCDRNTKKHFHTDALYFRTLGLLVRLFLSKEK